MFIAMDSYIYKSNRHIRKQFEAKFEESKVIESEFELLENNSHDLIAQDGSKPDKDPKK